MNQLKARVLDVIAPVWLDITQADIDAARANADKTGRCPGHRAAVRLFAKQLKDDKGGLFVGPSTVRVWADHHKDPVVYNGGAELRAFTSTWDNAIRGTLNWDGPFDDKGAAKPARIRLLRAD